MFNKSKYFQSFSVLTMVVLIGFCSAGVVWAQAVTAQISGPAED